MSAIFESISISSYLFPPFLKNKNKKNKKKRGRRRKEKEGIYVYG
jgi:hypothetical protein